MTVAELIATLEELPANMDVVSLDSDGVEVNADYFMDGTDDGSKGWIVIADCERVQKSIKDGVC